MQEEKALKALAKANLKLAVKAAQAAQSAADQLMRLNADSIRTGENSSGHADADDGASTSASALNQQAPQSEAQERERKKRCVKSGAEGCSIP